MEIQRPKNRGLSPRSPERLYSAKYACPDCGLSFEPPSPQLFSFNSPLGMCEACNGLGTRHEFILERIVEDEAKSIQKGALNLLGPVAKVGRWRRHILQGVARAIEQDCGLDEGEFLKTPWSELPDESRDLFLNGMGDRHITFAWRHRGGVWKHGGTWAGFLPELLEDYRKANSPMRRRQLEKYMETVHCSACNGERLNEQSRAVLITSKILNPCPSGSGSGKKSNSVPLPDGRSSERSTLSLPGVCALSIEDSARFFEALDLDDTQAIIAEDAIKEIRGRLSFLLKCGLGYLTLDRTAPTLSGGESQRIRLAGQIGCGLVGVLYILDEPSIGLHPRDNEMLIESLVDLRDQGNTVIVVEHDEETMRAADHIVDFGPGPGVRGGEIVAQGTLDEIRKAQHSQTADFLTGRREIAIPKQRREPTKTKRLKIVGAAHNNLRDIDVEIPLGLFVCVTGVSGSGKSSLCNDILWETLNRDINSGKGSPGTHKRINGLQHLDKAIDIDQSPIGRTPRSNPATYVKLLDEIRKLFTQLPQSKIRGYKPGRFSFNVEDGRCEACEGHGATKLEMDFLADIWVTCPVCQGKRFNHETLEVRYKEKSIADVLDMDVQEAIEHFKNHPKILRLLQTLHDVGLDYLKLGQPSPTLSGGEAQRIKLARELGKRSTGNTLYLLDEPTTGLHFGDVEKLLEVLHGFVDAGNTVLVIEHNLDVIKTADWVIDLGPEGGSGGGMLVAEGTPEAIAAYPESHTGAALQGVLGRAGGVNPLSPSTRTTSNGAGSSSTRNGVSRSQKQRTDVSRSPEDAITIRGAAQHNLQSVDITVPRDQMSVFCGPSGSGKTSLAMDTLYAEGQRRYVESLSAYARQFLGQMPKPKVESVSGLSPAIAIEQKTVGATPRSTVGTVTEIYDYLRVLIARLGKPYCPEHDVPVVKQTTDEIVDRVLALDEGTRLYLAAPIEIPVGQSYTKLWDRLGTQGFLRVRINGETHTLEDIPEIDHKREHTVEAIVDRIKVDPDSRGRIADSIETALDVGKGVLHLIHVDRDNPEPQWRVDRLSLHYSCPVCSGEHSRHFENLTPQNFSFNSPLGWCEACEGLGVEWGTNQQALVASPNQSLMDGAVSAWPLPRENAQFRTFLEAIAAEFGIPLDVPWYQLDSKHQRIILYGSDRPIPVPSLSALSSQLSTIQYKGLYPAIDEASRISYEYRLSLQDLVGEAPVRSAEETASVMMQRPFVLVRCRCHTFVDCRWRRRSLSSTG
ncbi:MAG: excinuclease ABC subunit UvrA [Planctomycetaceae bacterium]